MIKSITIISKLGKESIIFENNFDKEIGIPCSKLIAQSIPNFTIEIEFSESILFFRNHDYQWVSIKSNHVANSFCPKIIKLNNGFYVQSNSNQGIWEVDQKHPTKLFWKFNPECSNPITNYSDTNNQKAIAHAMPNFEDFITPSLLFSKKGAVEVSRSKIPFVATVCFTDHCDFDTADNLKWQRDFFKKHTVKITKGFFLNHFSKREDNASWENDSIELQKWVNDGHELCYHSLSQSIKSKEESVSDFFSFTPPLSATIWIDHGYQPYNLSMYQKEGIDEKAFAGNLEDKKIEILWNYIDSGTATSGVLNQLNPNHFTLQTFYKGIRKQPFKKRISLLIKNSIVHFYADEKLIKKYTQLASTFKKFMKDKSPKTLFIFSKNVLKVALPLFKLLLFWNRFKTRVYPLAKYQPLFFTHSIGGKKFVIFQTLELLDFVQALEKKSLDAFIEEAGMFVGHTYFSVPMIYHDGKIFANSDKIHPKVAENFEYLGHCIGQEKVWNPTLNELVHFWIDYTKVEFEILLNGTIAIKNQTIIPHRNIT